MKVVINRRYGGFGLSKEGQELYCELKGIDPGKYNKSFFYYEGLVEHDIARDDPLLVEVVEVLGEKASGAYAGLKIVDIPDDVKWEIEEYDGMEWVAEVHRTWS